MATAFVDQITGNGETVAYKAPCRVATTSNIVLSGLLAIDGVTVATDDRVLVKNQTDARQNGIYIANTAIWQRARDFNSNRDVTKGTRFTVTDGATNAGREYLLTSENPINVGMSVILITESLSSDSGANAAAAEAARDAAIIAKDGAENARDVAGGYASAANTSAENAATSESNAASSAGIATGAAGTATSAAGTATDAAGVASGAAGVATGARDDAIDARNAAQASEEKADKWANNPEDDPVEPGKFSAYHWSEKAKTAAGGGVQTVAEASNGHVAIDLADPENPVFDLKPDTISAILGAVRFIRLLNSAGEDLNDVRSPGWYAMNTNAGATAGTNYPVALAGVLEVIPSPANNIDVIQRYTTYRSSGGREFQRVMSSGAGDIWGAWKEWATTDAATPWNAPLVSQGAAEAGTSTDGNVKWSPERVAQAIAALAPPSIGIGQTWQDMTASRVLGTSYQNTTGRPIQLAVTFSGNNSIHTFQISPDGTTWYNVGNTGGNFDGKLLVSVIVTDGGFYRLTRTDGSTTSIDKWLELR